MVPKSRVSVVEQVYHQVPGGKSTAVVSRFNALSASRTPAHEVTVVATDVWTKLPGDWPTTVAMLVIQLPLKQLKEMPTPGEKMANNAQAVLVGFSPPVKSLPRTQHSPPVTPTVCTPAIRVGYGESCRFRPADVSHIWIRATSPGVTVVITAVPG